LKQKAVQKIITKLTSAFPIQVNEEIHIYSDFCLMMYKIQENGFCKKYGLTENYE